MIDPIISLFNQGNLKDALQQSNELVRDNPRSLEPRVLLAQLICFSGNWERAEKVINQLKTMDTDSEHAALTNLLDQMVSAELQRKSVWLQGAVPEFAVEPDEATKKLLWAWNCRREGKTEEYSTALQWVLENSPTVNLNRDGQNLGVMRDLDDMTCTVLEANSLYGSYYWLPLATISKVEVSMPTRPIDFLWNSARIKFTNDSEARMYLCGTYFSSFENGEDRFLLGRESEWQADQNGLEIGLGRKLFVAEDDEFTFFDFADIEFSIES